jgi:ubiquitin C-terminal hydrolase
MHEEVLKANGVKSNDPKLSETTIISRVFGGYLCNTLSCNKCKYASKTFNHFQDLSLDIHGGISSIASAIDSFIKPEFLSSGNEWKCDKCNLKVKVRRSNIYKS